VVVAKGSRAGGSSGRLAGWLTPASNGWRLCDHQCRPSAARQHLAQAWAALDRPVPVRHVRARSLERWQNARSDLVLQTSPQGLSATLVEDHAQEPHRSGELSKKLAVASLDRQTFSHAIAVGTHTQDALLLSLQRRQPSSL